MHERLRLILTFTPLKVSSKAMCDGPGFYGFQRLCGEGSLLILLSCFKGSNAATAFIVVSYPRLL